MISRALLNAPFFIPKDADLLRNRKVNTKKRQNRHLPELAFLILGTYFTAPFIRIEKVGNKELERIHTMVLSLQLLPFLSLRTGTHRYRQKQSLQRSVSAVPG